MKTLSEVIAAIKERNAVDWQDRWFRDNMFVMNIQQAVREKAQDVNDINTLLSEIKALQGILSDCQSESGAYQQGREDGVKWICEWLEGFNDLEELSYFSYRQLAQAIREKWEKREQ